VQPGWTTKDYSDDRHFKGEGNIGVRLEHPVKDADLDVIEAILAWPEFARATGMRYGHDSKLDSHWIYVSPEPLHSFKCAYPQKRTGGATEQVLLLEVRGTKADGSAGVQTVVPNSVHPSGERIKFTPGYDVAPAIVAAGDLIKAAWRTAAAALLARFAPGEGARHDFFIALAGAFYRGSFPLEDARQFHRALYRVFWPDHPDFREAEQDVESTYRKGEQDGQVLGITKLFELVDPERVSLAFKWLDITVERGRASGVSSDGVATNFELTRDAVQFRPPGKPPIFVCDRAEVLSLASTKVGEDWGSLVRFKDRRGVEHVVMVAAEDLVADSAKYRRELASCGLRIAEKGRGPDLLGEYIQFSPVKKQVQLAKRIGWDELGEKTYVLPNEVFRGTPGGEEVVYISKEKRTLWQVSGSAEEWRTHVGKKCEKNSRLIFCTSLPFAGPLLRMFSEESGGFHLGACPRNLLGPNFSLAL
jgi:hypothetical protein